MSELEKQNTVESKGQVFTNITYEGKEGGSPRIMFVGNSITRHGVRAEVGWFNDWGMAASSQENDYVHRVISFVQESHPEAYFCIVQAAIWEREYKNPEFSFDENFGPAKTFNPDVIICGISENASILEEDKETFAEGLHDLHSYLMGDRKDTKVIQGSSFFGNVEKSAAIKMYTDKYGATYVELMDISKDESNLAKGLFEHKGVQIHPGDKGMKMLADRYIVELKKIL